MTSKIELPKQFADLLSDLPEQGMGYQIVRVTLANGKVLTDRRVVNSTYLLLTENEQIASEDIVKVDLST
jgi:hypothetical protein